MRKLLLLFFFTIVFFSCQTKTESIDYFGQTPLGSSPVIFAPEKISVKGRFEHGISFTPDGKELAFGVISFKDFSGKIHYSKKVNGAWSEPAMWNLFETESVYLPYFAPDGHSLLFTQSSSDSANYLTDIWIAKKGEDTWKRSEKLDTPVNLLGRESTACITEAGTIYFTSNRNCPNNDCLADLYFSRKQNNKYSEVSKLSALSTPRDEESIFVAPDESYVIFCRYTGQKTAVDLYISYQNSKGDWLAPQMLDSAINTKHWERRPFVSHDKKYLFFTKLIFGQKGVKEADLYWVSTDKVFKPYVFLQLGNKIVKQDKPFEIQISRNTFADVNDTDLRFTFLQGSAESSLKFDEKTLVLSGNLSNEGDHKVTIRATDKSDNFVDCSFVLFVK